MSLSSRLLRRLWVLALFIPTAFLHQPLYRPVPHHHIATQRDTVAALSHMLRSNGGNPRVAEEVATAVRRYSARHGVDPVLVVGVIAVENNVLKRHARNPNSGATGVMQVMPFWVHDLRGCGRDLTNIANNVCFGTRVLALVLRHHSTRTGLLAYNGCVHTPGCTRYADLVLRKAAHARRVVPPLTYASR